jgi:hypothetical protein
MDPSLFSVAHLAFDAFSMLLGLIALAYCFLKIRSENYLLPTFISKKMDKADSLTSTMLWVILAHIWKYTIICIIILILVHFWALSEDHLTSDLIIK